MPPSENYSVQPLPFSTPLRGLSPASVSIHHDKLYQGYVNKRNEISDALSESSALWSSANQTYSAYRALADGLSFAANGIYLHEDYFSALGGNEPANGPLLDALNSEFGSLTNFLSELKAAGLAWRGWVVLAWDTRLGALRLYGGDTHHQGGVWGALPILVMDVYEHAYFQDYGADRAAYIEAFIENLNWTWLNDRFSRVKNIKLN